MEWTLSAPGPSRKVHPYPLVISFSPGRRRAGSETRRVDPRSDPGPGWEWTDSVRGGNLVRGPWWTVTDTASSPETGRPSRRTTPAHPSPFVRAGSLRVSRDPEQRDPQPRGLYEEPRRILSFVLFPPLSFSGSDRAGDRTVCRGGVPGTRSGTMESKRGLVCLRIRRPLGP